jgi:BirA family biotin operon repressor/biotin-[acetyl-CoA-carboxylase] ligase
MKYSLSPEAITRDLDTRLIGRRVIYYPSVASTNELAKIEARWGAVEGTVIIAGEQTAGKGRLKRAWLSPRGSLALSFILYPALEHLPSLIMVASLAVARSIKAVTGLEAGIKWPNDILLNGRKVCGILVESEVRGEAVDYAVIGIGVNVNLRVSDFPELLPTATSLSQEMGREVSLLGLVRGLLVEIERLYLALLGGGSIYEAWRDSLVTLGKRVYVVSGKASGSGIAESVAKDGSLLIRRPDGSLNRIVAGDVTLHHQTE